MSPRWTPLPRLGAASLALALATGCGGPPAPRTAADVLDAYAAAVEEGRYRDAYALLSAEAQRELPYDAFERMLRESPADRRSLVELLGRPRSEPRLTAVVTAPDGDTVDLVHEDGAWKLEANAVDLWGQGTPAAAVRSFVRAYRARRWDVLLRFVPDAERAGLTEATLKASWEGEQKAELDRLVAALEAALPSARIERTGDRASLAYGAQGTVELVREGVRWKIEELQ